MAESSIKALVQIIAAAVENKYPSSGPFDLDAVAAEVLPMLTDGDETDLMAKIRPVCGASDDINNQLICLILIDRFWSKPPRLFDPLTRLHGAALGKTGLPDLRLTHYVHDYGRVIPTPVSELSARLDELERLARHSIATMAKCSLNEKALMLAYIHGALIRIHPFADGNGRCGRFFILYALRCWEMPLFPIPKVRNDLAWKAAMDSAVAGDALGLRDQLYRKMQEAITAGDSFRR